MRIIKRYKNRKLYDTTTKLYTDNKKLLSILDSQESIQVVDYNNVDVTKKVLLQCVVTAHNFIELESLITFITKRRKTPCKE